MLRSGSEQKDRLNQTFLAALDLLDRERREPDRWEEECLSYALGALACGLYSAAEVELAAFARPANERLPEEVAMLNGKPRRFTKAMLRHGLDYVMARGNEGVDAATVSAGASHLAVRSFLGASL
ncbi:MAG: hypothetical protein JOY81_02655 [Alphaproteobacteria bacterium]|nr:hypothetical protein [Alphaproteobacteria bacterium]